MKIQCEHCFCQEENVKGKEHIKCCMCGVRRLKEPTIQFTTVPHIYPRWINGDPLDKNYWY
jgi:hypothetical protein